MSSRVRLIYRPSSGGIAWGRKAFINLLRQAQLSMNEENYNKLTSDLLTDPRLTKVPLWQRALTVKQRYPQITGRITVVREQRKLRYRQSHFLQLLRAHGVPSNHRRPTPASRRRPVDLSEPDNHRMPENSYWSDWERSPQQLPPPQPGSPVAAGDSTYGVDGNGWGMRYIWEQGGWYMSFLRDQATNRGVGFSRRGPRPRLSFDDSWRARTDGRLRAASGRPAPAPDYVPPRIGVYR
jgi:hypothetical protein